MTSLRDASEINKRLVAEFFSVYRNHHYEKLHELIANDYADHSPAGARSPQDVVRTLQSVERAFPDLQVELRDLFAEKDRVAVRVWFSGTHSADYMDMCPKYRRVEWEAVELFRIDGARIVESWGYWPDQFLREQMR